MLRIKFLKDVKLNGVLAGRKDQEATVLPEYGNRWIQNGQAELVPEKVAATFAELEAQEQIANKEQA